MYPASGWMTLSTTQRSVGIDEWPIVRSKLTRKLVKVKVHGTPYRIELQQDTVGPFAESSKEAAEIDLPQTAIMHLQHDSRRQYPSFDPAPRMLA